MSQPVNALPRLLQLVSPSLPIGAFTYSQGIEWAVEAGWIKNRTDLSEWIDDQLDANLAYLDIPVLRRLYGACVDRRYEDFASWTDSLLAQAYGRRLATGRLRPGGTTLANRRRNRVARLCLGLARESGTCRGEDHSAGTDGRSTAAARIGRAASASRAQGSRTGRH